MVAAGIHRIVSLIKEDLTTHQWQGKHASAPVSRNSWTCCRSPGPEMSLLPERDLVLLDSALHFSQDNFSLFFN